MKVRREADRLALVAGAALLLVMLVWAAWGEREVAAVGGRVEALLDADVGALTGTAVGGAIDPKAAWRDPAMAANSEAWVFDLFTPPVIYYNRTTGRFSVTPPETDRQAAVEAAAAEPFGLELIAVERTPYRLQLVGYAGRENDYLGIFENKETGEAKVARAGARWAELGLEVRSLVVQREDLMVPDSMPLREIVAVAEVWDEREKRSVRLSSAGPVWTDAPTAIVRVTETDVERPVRAGDRFEVGGVTFEISAITDAPGTLTARKLRPDGVLEVVTLQVAATNAVEPANSPF